MKFETKQASLAWIFFATTIGLWIRCATSDYPLWHDELMSVWFAQQPLNRLWSDWMVLETNPPLYYSFLHWCLISGAASFKEIRLVSIVAGVASIPLISAIGWKSGGPRVAVTAALFAAVSAKEVWFSQLARGYMFAYVGVLLSLAGLVWWRKGERERLPLLLYVTGCLIGIYCHVTMMLWPAIATAAVIVLEARTRKFAFSRRLILADLAILVGASWEIHIVAKQLASPNVAWIAKLSLPEYVRLYWHSTILIFDGPPHTLALRLALIGLIVVGAFALSKSASGRLILSCWLMSFLTFGIVQVVHPIVLSYTIFWMTAFTILSLSSAVWVFGARPGIILTGLGVAALYFNLADKMDEFWWEDWPKAFAEASRHPGGAIVVSGGDERLVADVACRIHEPSQPCRVPILTVGSLAMPWVKRVLVDRPIDPAKIDATLARYSRLYSVAWSAPYPLVMLGVEAPHGCCASFIQGPVSPQQITSHRFPRAL